MKNASLILLLDDDEVSNFIGETILKAFFKESKIISTENSNIAIDIITKHIDSESIYLFLDINMPEISGWDFLDLLESKNIVNENKLKVIMLSSSIDKIDIDRSKSHPLVYNYITKPLSNNLLKDLFN